MYTEIDNINFYLSLCPAKINHKIFQIKGKNLLSSYFWAYFTTRKLLKKLLAFLNLYQHTTNQFIPITASWDTANFRVLRPERPFLSKMTPIFFNKLLILMNLHQDVKNQAFSSFCSRDIVHLEILQSGWLKAFLSISQEPDFYQPDMYKNTANNINFCYRSNLENISD